LSSRLKLCYLHMSKRNTELTRLRGLVQVTLSRGSTEERLSLLRELANYVIYKRNAEKLKKKRRAFDGYKQDVCPLGAKCKVCGEKADVRHHMIQLKHGGLN